MKLTQEVLDSIVKTVVPKKYQPPVGAGIMADEGNPPPVTNISVMKSEDFMKRALFHCPDAKNPLAITINWGLLYKMTKYPDWEKHRRSCCIFFKEDLGNCLVTQLEFIVAHEIGHVDWHFMSEEEKRMWTDEREVYADYFAAETLAKVYDRDLAQTMLKCFGSAWNKRKENMDA